MDKKKKHRQITNRYGILFAVMLMGIVFTLSNRNFLITDNVINILRWMAVMAIVAIGMTLIMVTGDTDVGVGGVACLTGTVISLLMSRGISIPLVLLVELLVGAALKSLNGALVTRFALPPMVMTLGTMNLTNRIANLSAGGMAVYGLPEGFLVTGRGDFLGVPNQVQLLAMLAIASTMALNKTPFGRHVYAIGGNAEVTKLSGIHAKKVKVFLYIVSGVCASMNGITLNSRTGSGQSTLAATINMNVVMAMTIGGTSLNGGSETIWGSIMEALLLTIIINKLNVSGINSYWQPVASAIVLIITIIANRND